MHTLLPSLMNSSKLASLGDVVGTFNQDRATAIAGTLGAAPRMLPITLVLDTDRGPSRTFNFSVVRDQLFTPLLTYLSVVNTLRSYEREFGTSSFMVKGRALVDKHGEIAFEDLFTGDSPSIGAASYIAGPITFLLKNDFEPVEINTLDLTIMSSESAAHGGARARMAGCSGGHARPNGSAEAAGANRRGRGRAAHGAVDIPANATGPLT